MLGIGPLTSLFVHFILLANRPELNCPVFTAANYRAFVIKTEKTFNRAGVSTQSQQIYVLEIQS